MRNRSASTTFVFLVLALTAISGAVNAQVNGYPVKPIRFVVPFTPGAINDYLARSLGQKLSESFGQQVIVDNRPGAGTIVGTDIVAKSAPDGYTMLLTSTAFAINARLYSKLPFDVARDFAPVTRIGFAPLLLVASPQLQANTVKDLVALAKAKPGHIAYASTGSGGSAHLMGEMFKSMAGIDLVHIPYKGLAPALIDVVAGRVPLTFGTYLAVNAHIKAGRVRALAVTSKVRSRAVPELPTIAESGYPAYDASAWWGIAVPARTPKPVIARLNSEAVRILESREVGAQMFAQGVEVAATTPEAFTRYVAEEIERWGTVIKQSGAKPE
jgi:tripartite-type tricarboxylate transporter receptor subunit TctC